MLAPWNRAANLRTAMGFGQIAFAVVLLYLMVRRYHRGRAVPTHVSGSFDRDLGLSRIPRGAGVRDSPPMMYTVYFCDSEECLRCMSRRAASEAEAHDWFTRMGIAVVAIQLEPAS